MIKAILPVFFIMTLGCGAFAEGILLSILDEDITAYTGPGRNYRALTTLTKNTKVSASPSLVQAPNGEEFYKVLIQFKGGMKRVGFISTRENVKVETAEQAEDIERYRSLLLSSSSLQAGFYTWRGTQYLWTLAYLKYPAPSFFLKIFTGQVLSKTASSVLLGGGLGTDHFISDHFSLYTDFGTAVLLAPKDNLLFDGSRSMNTFLQGGTGIRYNAELAAVSLGLLQSLVLNQNNSHLTWGGGITLEVGL